MLWKIYFWTITALLVLPLPWKIFEYITGRDKSPKVVKIEEMGNIIFFFVGLIGLYGFTYRQDFLAPVFWRAWVVLAVILTVAGPFISPKFKYAIGIMGKTRLGVILGVGFLVYAPMLVGVFAYSAAI